MQRPCVGLACLQLKVSGARAPEVRGRVAGDGAGELAEGEVM